MKRWNLCYLFVLPVAAATLLLVSGCNPSQSEKTADQSAPPVERARVGVPSAEGSATNSVASEADGEHGHIPGSHGGIMISLGRDSYHVEAVIDSEGAVRLYTLGKDESRVIDVESQSLNGFVKAEGDADSKSISFEPSPQEGDSSGKTSQFVGQLPKDLVGRKLDVTIPNIKIDGERFRLGFQSGQDDHSDVTEMPDKVADGVERELYLTPGGRYTAADIEANGNMTASQKFKNFKSAHDMNPKVGDRICPITDTKANSQCTWIVDGKSYQFCCPPCVDEFLASAKNSTDPLPDPESFTKK